MLLLFAGVKLINYYSWPKPTIVLPFKDRERETESPLLHLNQTKKPEKIALTRVSFVYREPIIMGPYSIL